MKTRVFFTLVWITIIIGCSNHNYENTSILKEENSFRDLFQVIYLIDESKSNPYYFIKKPTEEELTSFYDIIGERGGNIFTGLIGTTHTSMSPYTSYYNCRLNVLEPSTNALYREKMMIRAENEKIRIKYNQQRARFIENTIKAYSFNEDFTDIICAANKAVNKFRESPKGSKNILIIHSDMIHDLGKPVRYTLNIPLNINIHVIGMSYVAKVSFSPDGNVHFHDTFNDFVNHIKNLSYEKR